MIKPTKEILDALQSVEDSHFRTDSDTGANPTALIVWSALRAQFGLPYLSRKDLPHFEPTLQVYTRPSNSKLIANIRFIYED